MRVANTSTEAYINKYSVWPQATFVSALHVVF